jgi:hypothetical protein
VDWEDWSLRLRQFNAGLDADQVEREAIRVGLTSIEFGTEDERTSGMVDDALETAGNSWAERQEVLETLSGAVADEVHRRADMMGNAYPFAISDGALEYAQSKTGVYEFCLAASSNPTGEAQGYPRASAVFEYIARDVIAVHIGGGQGFRTGAPVYASEARGSTTKETFAALHAQCGEFRWNPNPNFPNEPSHVDLKDAGLDVVVWKPWPDRRNAHLFVLGQCACGKNDVGISKARELSLVRLNNWLRPVSYAHPVRAFLAAHHIPNSMQLYELSGEGGIVFDRARIALIAENAVEFMNREGTVNYKELGKLYLSSVATT